MSKEKQGKERKKSEVQKLNEELEKKEKEVKEYLDSLKRLKAEFENYQKRIEKEKVEFRKYACEDLLLKLIGIKDNFERALKNVKEDEFVKGIKMIMKQMEDTLEREGVRVVKAIGEKFDPYRHEAVAHGNGNEDGLILEELERGYELFEKVIRPSKVKVSKFMNDKNE